MGTRFWQSISNWSTWAAPLPAALIAWFTASPPAEDQEWYGITYGLARGLWFTAIGAAFVLAVVAIVARKLAAKEVATREAQSRSQLATQFASVIKSYQRTAQSGWNRTEAQGFHTDLLDQLNSMLHPDEAEGVRCCYYSYAADDGNEANARLCLYSHTASGSEPRTEFLEGDDLGKHIIGRMKANQDVVGKHLNRKRKAEADSLVLNDPRYANADRPYSSFVSKPIRDTRVPESDGLLGMLTVDFRAGPGPTQEQKRILAVYAQILTSALVGSEHAPVQVPGPTRPKEAQR